MHQVNDFRGTVFVRDADSPTARHHPQEILMADLETPLIGQVNCKWLERRPLSRCSDLLRCHTQIIDEWTAKVQSPQICA
jgi:hypothetical protein